MACPCRKGAQKSQYSPVGPGQCIHPRAAPSLGTRCGRYGQPQATLSSPVCGWVWCGHWLCPIHGGELLRSPRRDSLLLAALGCRIQHWSRLSPAVGGHGVLLGVCRRSERQWQACDLRDNSAVPTDPLPQEPPWAGRGTRGSRAAARSPCPLSCAWSEHSRHIDRAKVTRKEEARSGRTGFKAAAQPGKLLERPFRDIQGQSQPRNQRTVALLPGSLLC